MDPIWQRFYPSGVPTEINPDEFTSIIELFEYSCRLHAELPAFTNLGVSLTYAELDEKSRCFAAYLQQQCHLKKGDRVAIMLPNLLQYPVVLFGILRAGLVVVNLNPLYTAPEVQRFIANSGAESIVVLANFAKTLEKIVSRLLLKNIIVTEVGDLLGPFKKTMVNAVVKYIKRGVPTYNLPNAISFLVALNAGQKLKCESPELSGKDLAFLQYTGGTTGHPKAAMLTHRNIVANILQCKAWVKGVVKKPGEDVVLTALPIYHIFSLTVCCMTFMALGGHCLLITDPRDMRRFLKTLSQLPVTIFIGLNTLFNAMMNHSDFAKLDFSRLKLTVAGGMAVQEAVAKQWHEKTGVPISQGYGLTEASPVVSINPIHLKTFNNSVGLPIPSTEIDLRENELCVRGPQVMAGYWREPEATKEVLDQDGWLFTGDIAKVDDQGFIYIVDRKKEMILVSGFNVYPNEIEEVLCSHPGIQEAAVVGVPNEKTGEAIKAVVVKQDPSLTEQSIIDYCRQSLTGYKIPRFIEFRDELTKSSVGKVLRSALKDSQ